MKEMTLREKAMMLKALIMFDAKIEKFDEIFTDAMSEFLGGELWQIRSFFFQVLGFPADTYYNIGYDEDGAFCDDGLHDMLTDLLYMVDIDKEEMSDYRLGNPHDPGLLVFEEKVLELEKMAKDRLTLAE